MQNFHGHSNLLLPPNKKKSITITHQKKVASYFFTSSPTGITEENSLQGTKYNLRCMTNTFGITEARLPDKLWPAPFIHYWTACAGSSSHGNRGGKQSKNSLHCA